MSTSAPAENAKAAIEELPVVHAITNDEIMLRPGFLRKAMGIMRVLESKGAIHVRSQLLDTPTLYSITLALLELHEQTRCWCIVNDRVDIALACGVQGVQLTHKSISVPDVQRIAPALLIGASVHSADEARDAEQAGADWCVAGHVFETPSHPGEPRRENNFIPDVVAAVKVPVIAIGGIRPEHVRSLVHRGAHGIAAIRGIWNDENAELAASRYLSQV
ncbi:MAG TPA: thiamine phosphate synthase [Gemmatimonadaceae bacterium]|nr:thiamine phosphate synthase [Gemmatimonadaceae bacterium]